MHKDICPGLKFAVLFSRSHKYTLPTLGPAPPHQWKAWICYPTILQHWDFSEASSEKPIFLTSCRNLGKFSEFCNLKMLQTSLCPGTQYSKTWVKTKSLCIPLSFTIITVVLFQTSWDIHISAVISKLEQSSEMYIQKLWWDCQINGGYQANTYICICIYLYICVYICI